MWLLLLFACGREPVPDAKLYRNGLASGDCSPIRDSKLRDDCWVATAETKSLRARPCDLVSGDRYKGECWFVIAEREKDASYCSKAGVFTDDCALHVLSGGFASWVKAESVPGDQDAEFEERIKTSGMKATDPRPWSAYYRWVLGQHRPLDRKSCAKVEDPMRREACEKTGLAVYNDLLNNARDRKLLPCPSLKPLPPELAHTPDPELDSLLSSREDLCSG